VSGSSSTRTSLSPYTTPPAAPAITPFTAGATALTVNGPTTRAAGNYGNVTVNSTLTLSGGTYQFQNLTLGPNAVVQAAAATKLRIAGKITGSNNVRLVPTGTQGAATLRIFVNGATDATGGVVLGNEARLTALLVSRASVTTGDRLVGSGAISAKDITLGIDARFTFAAGFECNTDASCDDGNACTADACADAQCTHSVAPNGTACADDGNDCTSDVCTAGACAHPTVPEGTECSGGTCNDAGVCAQCSTDLDCDDGLPCTTDGCFENACSHDLAYYGTPCGDGLICDGTGSCNAAECTNDAACDDQLPCTTDSCFDFTCTHGSVPSGTSCGDDLFCDGAGSCVPGPECTADAECNDGNDCTFDRCFENSCGHDFAQFGSPCGDGLICDGVGGCNPAACMADADCDDGLPCTTDLCIDFGCFSAWAPEGTPCGDGMSCNDTGGCHAPEAE
jgi:hypothetical protein